MYCHDLDVMSSNPGEVKLGLCSTSILEQIFFHIYIYKNVFTYEIVSDVLICFCVQINEIQSTR